VSSSDLITAILTLSPNLVAGDHLITVNSNSSAVTFHFTALPSSTVPVTLTGLSSTLLPPLAPITLTGSGFTAGGQAGSTVVLQYTYGGQIAQVSATPTSDTQIDSTVPVFGDPSTGALY